ncbi:MAG: PD-(D/E)XK nuclease family protein [Arenicellales bacterium]
MKPETIKRIDLHQKLRNGSTVVTGNARLAVALQQEFQQQAIDDGLKVWETPDIKPWSIWLRQTWEEAVFDGLVESPALLLTDEQEQYVWEAVIESSTEPVLRKEATAKKASEAWRQLINWQVNRDETDFTINEDTQAFQFWADEFERQCDEQGWLPASRMAEQLVQSILNDPDALNNHIILLGFDELTPLQQALYAAISDSTGSIQWAQLSEAEAGSSTAVRLACADNDDEINTLALWIRKRLQEKPDSRIGVVVPDLGAHRSNLIRRLTEILVPGNLMAEGDEPLPWNISLGLPLKHYPVIETAFNLLDLACGGFPLENIGPLLNSPYLAGAAEELGARALLDRKLRDIGEQKVSLKTLCWLAANTDRPWFSPELAKNVNKLEELVEKAPGTASSADWVKLFAAILNAAGWAKDRDFNSEEYQAIEAFHKLLARFSGLQAVSGRLSYSRALGMLKRLALAQIFQPRGDATPIQILGLYEAIGLQFDALWVMDLHDGNWPASPQPNPFIPLSLQRQLAMPHADQARELAIAQGITERLLIAAPDVVMSYPLRKGEEQLRLSPLIRDLAEGDSEALALMLNKEPTWSETIQQSRRTELLADDRAPELPQQRASGGSGIFKYQSLCPFRAFAQYRLSATALVTPQVGLDAMKRGQLFHKVLELFWRDVRDLKTLLAMNEETLRQKLDDVIVQAIDAMAEQNPDIFSPRFRQIESSRLKQLTLQWLEIEKQRADFTVVDFEKEVWHEVNGINIHLWIDRIDELADGRKVVIDYKTGIVSPSQWFGERPEEPQLPLYSMVESGDKDTEVSAVLYGQLKAADMKFSGVVAEEGLIPNLPPARNPQLKEVTELWPQVLDDWQHTINQLAGDFRSGKADVDPKKPSTCETSYCELSGLCRIDELMAETETETGAEDE